MRYRPLGPQEYLALALFLAFFVGTIQLLMGFLKLGVFVHFLSRPVISGFTSAAAALIGLSQLNHLLGVSIPRSNKIHELFIYLIELIPQAHGPTVLVSVCVCFIFCLKAVFSKLPAVLILVVLATVTVAQFKEVETGLILLENVPGGLSMILPSAEWGQIYALIPLALTLASSHLWKQSLWQKLSKKKRKQTHSMQIKSLLRLGAANVVGSIFQAYPTTGGLSRTAVNYDAGAKSGISALFSALVVGLTLLFFTSFFYFLPTAILGAIIVVAIVKLIDFNYPRELWKTTERNFFILLFTFLVTLFIGIKEGILLGVFVALLYMVYQNTQPHIAVLGRIKDTHYFKNITRFSEDVITYPNVLILRFDGQLFFGNQTYFRETVSAHIKKQKPLVKHLVIASAGINSIDASAQQMLSLFMEELDQKQINIYWTGLIGPLRDQFYKAGFLDQFDGLFVFSSLEPP